MTCLTVFYFNILVRVMILWVERNTQLFCFLVGLVCSIPLIFITPPFQVPDEPQHFYRAYQISEGQLLARVENRVAGGMLPSSLIKLSSDHLGSRAIHTERPIIKRPWSVSFADFATPLLPYRREFIDFSGAAFYSPIPYIPQSSAIALGRMFGAGPLAFMYLARLVNVIVAVFLISLAVRHSPLSKPGFMAAGLLPMSVYLFASLSPDAMVIGSAFLYTSLALEAYANKNWTTSNLVMAIICATIFCSIKIVYAPLILIAFFSGFDTERPIKSLGIQTALIIIPISITVMWMHSVSGLIVPVKLGTSVVGQLQHVIGHPFLFLQAVAHGFLWNEFYFFTTIGVLGWLKLKLPTLSYCLAAVSLLISIFSVSHIKSVRSSFTMAWWGVLALSSIGLIMLALYLYWTAVAAVTVDGVQGRYFIPVLPLLATVIAGALSNCSGRLSPAKALILVAGLGIAEALLTFFCLLTAYWIF